MNIADYNIDNAAEIVPTPTAATGTISCPAEGRYVTGSGTDFTNLKKGSFITVATGEIYEVISASSETLLYVAPHDNDAVAAVAFGTITSGITSVSLSVSGAADASIGETLNSVTTMTAGITKNRNSEKPLWVDATGTKVDLQVYF